LMKPAVYCLIYFFIVFTLASCAVVVPNAEPTAKPNVITTEMPVIAPEIFILPTAAQIEAATSVNIDVKTLTTLLNRALFRMTPLEVGQYIAYLQIAEPNLGKRIAHLGRKNIGQPYEIYLLGEFPFETTDQQPLFTLEKSDCVVFAEHTYAMALSSSWQEFFWMLQRIRYRDGVIGVTTRNHYTEVDWNPQNRWLVSDITRELAKERTATYELVVDRTKFFKSRYKLDHVLDVENTTETYIPKNDIASLLAQLQEGDFVNVISGKDGKFWASHVGIVVIGTNGERHLLHSIEPAVREETL